MSHSVYNPKVKRSLFALISELPAEIGNLVTAELHAFTTELTAKAKSFGIGAALFAAAGLFAFFGFAVLIALAIIALALVLQLWFATLIVAFVLLLIAVVLALLGLKNVKSATARDPEGVRASIRLDVDAIKGVGDYGN